MMTTPYPPFKKCAQAGGGDLQPGGLHQRGELVEVPAQKIGAEQRPGLVAGVADGEVEEPGEGVMMFQCARHEYRNGAAEGGGSGHLPHRGGAVGEEHQRHLREHRVEGFVWERQPCRVGLTELDVGSDPAGNGEHRVVQVHAHGTAGRSDSVGGGAGDDPGSEGDVEHAGARCHAGSLAQHRRPLGEEGRDKCRLVELGGLASDLEGLRRFGGGHVGMLCRSVRASIGQLPYSVSRSGPKALAAWTAASARLRRLSLVSTLLTWWEAVLRLM